MAMIMLHKVFREFIELLEKNNVKYLVVGGHAVAVHGYPRLTGDLDIFIQIDPNNARQVYQTFRDFGFLDLDISEKDFLTPDTIVEVGREPLKIQVINDISGVTFEECFTDHIKFNIGNCEVPMISLANLLKNKKASGRNKDLTDVIELRKRNSQN